MTRCTALHIALVIALGLAAEARRGWAQRPEVPATEAALSSIFSPRRAPAAKTMGLVQRNFLDLVEVSHSKLQVALVIDGTESMGTEIDGIRQSLHQMVDDLRLYKDVSFQLVVFRDEGAASGVVSFPLDMPQGSFTSDPEALHAAIETIKPETGAPYFPELIDLGMHRALTELNWSTEPDTARWLLVFSDAPPFDEGFEEPAAKAVRRFATQQLIGAANRLDIKINCVLCTSRPEDRQVYEQALTKTRQFMSQVSSGTGGLMLDLSYPDIRAALETAAQIKRVTYQPIGQITREDVNQARLAAQQAALAPSGRVQIAVLPHMPLDELSFDPKLPAVQVAAEFRHRLRALPNTDVKSPLSIERHVAILKARGIRGPQLLPALATALNADYLVWGSLSQEQGNLELKSNFYGKTRGQDIVTDVVRTSPQLPVTEMTAQLASSLGQKLQIQKVDNRLATTLGSLKPGTLAQQRFINPVSQTEAGRTNLLAGFEALEKALAYAAGSQEAEPLLAQARSSLALARQEDQQNPLVYLLLASAAFNDAQVLSSQGKSEEAAAALRECSQALSLAYRFRREAKFDYLRREIEADYHLLVGKSYPEAIAAYEELSQLTPDTPLHTALRAHWMLAGIYSGDWGLAKNEKGKAVIDPAKARGHLIQILANWSDSSEAEFIRRNLRWDEETGTNRFEHFPRVNEAAAEAVVGA